MKTDYVIPRVSPKLKRSSTPYSCNGETVYIYLDRMDGSVAVSYDPKFDSIFDVAKEDISPARKNGTIQSKPKSLTVDEKADKDDLNDFYREMGEHVPFNCVNCDRPLYAYTAWAKRCSTAHILPKSSFDSIKANPQNILFMGSDLMCACGCHDIWDASIEKRKSMRIYPYAVELFTKYLRYELNDEDLISACDYLGLTNWKDYVNA